MSYGRNKWYSDNYTIMDDGVLNNTPLALYFGKFHNYNSQWKIPRVIVFEYFIMLAKKFGNDPFYRQQQIVTQETRLSPHKFRKERDYLIEKGFLSLREGDHGRHLYSVNKKAIVLRLDEILEFEKIKDPSERSAYKQIVAQSFAKYLKIEDQIDLPHYNKSLCE